MSVIQGLLSLTGRLLLVTIFVSSAIMGKILNFNATVALMTEHGVPLPTVALVGAIAFLLVGGVSVGLGLFTRLGATLLLIFLGSATYCFHDFWTIAPDQTAAVQAQMVQFLKNLALGGGMLFLIANGAGVGSLDRLIWRPAKADEDD